MKSYVTKERTQNNNDESFHGTFDEVMMVYIPTTNNYTAHLFASYFRSVNKERGLNK